MGKDKGGVISRLDADPCTGCGRLLDAATGPFAQQEGPKPGDLTICAYCGELMLFKQDGEALGLEAVPDQVAMMQSLPEDQYEVVVKLRKAARDGSIMGLVRAVKAAERKAAN